MNIFDFQCKCGKCGDVFPAAELVKILHDAEMHYGKEVQITSGYRCDLHNQAQGGFPRSRHMQKQAVDCHIEGVTHEEFYNWLCLTYPQSYGFGVYNYHVHIDSRMNGAARWDARG